MPWAVAAAGISAAATIGSSVIGSNAASDATKAQTDAAGQAAGYLRPYMDAGGNSLQALQRYIGVGADGSFNPQAPGVAPFSLDSFRSSPGYGFQLDQGLSAIRNGATVGGGVHSGNTLKALMSYGQGLANQDYYNAANMYRSNQIDTINSLSGLTDIGKQAAGASGGISLQAGNARAAGSVAQGQIMGNALNGLVSPIQQLFQGFGAGGGSGNTVGNTYTSPYSYTDSYAGWGT